MPFGVTTLKIEGGSETSNDEKTGGSVGCGTVEDACTRSGMSNVTSEGQRRWDGLQRQHERKGGGGLEM